MAASQALLTELNLLREHIIAHAAACYPRESCGLIVNIDGVDVYVPCNNRASGDDYFIIAPEDYAQADMRGEIIAVVHSHPNCSAGPSDTDKLGCAATGIPWIVLSYPNIEWWTVNEDQFVGRIFEHGKTDCYSIIRDWYQQKYGAVLPDFSRSDEWWEKSENLYLDNFGIAGFYEVKDQTLQIGDVLLMRILSPVPNHGAVYVGDNTILHHLYNQLSRSETYNAFFRRATTHVLRYHKAS